PAGVRLIVSALEHGEAPQTGQAAPDWLAGLRAAELPEVPVPGLSEDECRGIIRELPRVFCKTLDDDQVTALLRNRATRNPLFLTAALEELRTFGSFEKLPGAIAALPRLEAGALPGEHEKALNELF